MSDLSYLAREVPFAGSFLAGFVDLEPLAPQKGNFLYGQGLDGRLFTDLSVLTEDRLIVPTADFYVRTRASTLLPPADTWGVELGGHSLPVSWFVERRQSLGEVLLECAGNMYPVGHRMLSSATWEGVPLRRMLQELDVSSTSSHLMVSGFDEYPEPSRTVPPSTPGADWVFPLDRLLDSGAALVTHMNGAPLTRDHGAPIRLLVPNWYGCCNIKWVTRLQFVPADMPTTSHMQWFAERTQQDGIPARVCDYQDPIIRTTAMPIRIEQWRRHDKVMYRIVGVVWGTPRPPALQIRLGGPNAYKPVHYYQSPSEDRSWSLWYHCFHSAAPGLYSIQIRTDPPMPGSRLDCGYYKRFMRVQPAVAVAPADDAAHIAPVTQ